MSETALTTLRSSMEAAMPKLQEVAPKHLKVDRLVRILLSACSRNPKLLECSKESVLNFCMKCSETGLEPIGAGGAWPVPYKNKSGTIEMQFIPDWRGLINCAKHAGCITDAYAEVVKENDTFDYELGLNPSLTHKPASKDRGDLVNAYCIFTLPDGSKRFVVMDADEIESIRKRSKAGDFGPWKTDTGEMWKKTVVRRAMKPFAGMNPELDTAIDADNAATGLVQRDPISMPVSKGAADLAEKLKGKQESTEPPKPEKTDRAGQLTELKRLYDASSAKKCSNALKAIGVEFDSIEAGQELAAFEKFSDEQITTVTSLLVK